MYIARERERVACRIQVAVVKKIHTPKKTHQRTLLPSLAMLHVSEHAAAITRCISAENAGGVAPTFPLIPVCSHVRSPFFMDREGEY